MDYSREAGEEVEEWVLDPRVSCGHVEDSQLHCLGQWSGPHHESSFTYTMLPLVTLGTGVLCCSLGLVPALSYTRTQSERIMVS